MLERHPQMDPPYHEIQLDLPGDNQTGSRANPLPPHNITVEYAEKQMSHNERNFLQMLSTFTNTPECVDEIAVATSLDAELCSLFRQYIMTQKGQNGLHVNILHTIF